MLFTSDDITFAEFAAGGALFDLLHKQQYKPGHAQALKWAQEIAEGVYPSIQQGLQHMSDHI